MGAVKQRDLVFFAGGECFSRYGTFVKRTSPSEDIPETFARDSVQSYVNRLGYLKDASADVLAANWVDTDGDGLLDTPLPLFNAAYENLITSDDFDSGWTSSGTPVVTSGVADPAGGTAAYTIADDNGAAQEYKYLEPTFTGDAVKSVVFVVKEATMASSGNQLLGVYDTDATAWVLQMLITAWSSGEPTITEDTGTLLDKYQIGSTGWWVLVCQTTSVTAGNTNQFTVRPASTAAATGSISVYRVNAFDAPYPPRSIMDATSPATLEATDLSYTFPFPPDRVWTIYGKIENHMLADAGVLGYLLSLGNYSAAGSALALRANSANDNWAVATRTTDTGQVTSVIGSDNAPSVGDDFEFCLRKPAAGNITWTVKKNGGTESSAQTHTLGTWGSVLNQLTLTVGATYAGASHGNFGLYALKVALADHTMTEMAAAY